MSCWQFWIDVGGTFTDCLAVSPAGTTQVVKVLSSGRVKGALIANDATALNGIPTTLATNVADFWRGYELFALDGAGGVIGQTRVTGSDPSGVLTLADADLPLGTRFELSSGEGAPLLAIRQGLSLRLDEPVPPVAVRLGTTRGTNALLTRTGARTGFVTTQGFRDVLLIANQDRPRLFELAIQKPTPLFHAVAEIEERLAADGSVLRSPADEQIRHALTGLRDAGCESLAICLLHAFANPTHEERVAQVAAELGFRHISVSSRLSPLIKIVPRGDTTVMDAYLNPVLRDYVAQLTANSQAAM